MLNQLRADLEVRRVAVTTRGLQEAIGVELEVTSEKLFIMFGVNRSEQRLELTNETLNKGDQNESSHYDLLEPLSRPKRCRFYEDTVMFAAAVAFPYVFPNITQPRLRVHLFAVGPDDGRVTWICQNARERGGDAVAKRIPFVRAVHRLGFTQRKAMDFEFLSDDPRNAGVKSDSEFMMDATYAFPEAGSASDREIR